MLRGLEGEGEPGMVMEYRAAEEASEHLPRLWQLALVSLPLFPPFGQGEVT